MPKVINIDYNKIYETKRGEKYYILESLGIQPYCNTTATMVRIQFVDTGYKRVIPIAHAIHGRTADPYHRIVCGIGYLGEPPKGYDTIVYDIWYSMITKAYSNEVKVSDRWKCFAHFYEDFPKLLGYDIYKDDQTHRGFHVDIYTTHPEEGIIYSLKTCHLANKTSSFIKSNLSFIGVSYKKKSYEVSIDYDGETYFIGHFLNEIAAASAYNYIAGQLPGLALNRLYSIEPKEWLLARNNQEPMEVPLGVNISNYIKSACQIIVGKSLYNGVVKVREGTYQAYYHDYEGNIVTIGIYNSEIVAASVYEYHCRQYGIASGNILPYLVPINEIDKHKALSNREYKLQHTSEITINGLIIVGQVRVTPKGDKYEILSIDSPDPSSNYTKILVTIKFLDTGYITTVISKVIEDGLVIEDKLKSDIYGIGYIGGKFTRNQLTTRIYNMWIRLLKQVTSLHPEDASNYIDSSWLCFLNFLDDVSKIEGHLLLTSLVIQQVFLSNLKYQLDIPKEHRVWNKQVCYLTTKAYEEKYHFYDENTDSSKYLGIRQTKNGNYTFEITNHPYLHKTMKHTYNNQQAAVNAYNFHCQYLYGIAPNRFVEPMSYNEFIKYRVLFKGEPIKQLYHLTNEDEETRKSRVLKIYGSN